MISHVGKPSNPVVCIKICVSPPSVAIVPRTTPFAAGHVVVKIDINLVLGKLLCNSVIDLIYRHIS